MNGIYICTNQSGDTGELVDSYKLVKQRAINKDGEGLVSLLKVVSINV